MSITSLVLYQGYGLQECNVTCDAVLLCVQLLTFSAIVGPLSSGLRFLPGLPNPHNEGTISSRMLTVHTHSHSVTSHNTSVPLTEQHCQTLTCYYLILHTS